MDNDCCAVRISGEKTTRTRFEERYFKVQKFFRTRTVKFIAAIGR